ncbi:hypothetical protein B296_00033558 [Ensete ventricosum]|uniref:Uncharacterized protein n=1 Tax=Ensete ventricosum TaxID=4639 RepID=A0A426Y0H8_ENSVE|nr:hypothetical protein B296_00033558 [Ensete ventricosum]
MLGCYPRVDVAYVRRLPVACRLAMACYSRTTTMHDCFLRAIAAIQWCCCLGVTYCLHVALHTTTTMQWCYHLGTTMIRGCFLCMVVVMQRCYRLDTVATCARPPLCSCSIAAGSSDATAVVLSLSMTATEGRRRAAKLVSRLRLQSKRGPTTRGRVAALEEGSSSDSNNDRERQRCGWAMTGQWRKKVASGDTTAWLHRGGCGWEAVVVGDRWLCMGGAVAEEGVAGRMRLRLWLRRRKASAASNVANEEQRVGNHSLRLLRAGQRQGQGRRRQQQ